VRQDGTKSRLNHTYTYTQITRQTWEMVSKKKYIPFEEDGGDLVDDKDDNGQDETSGTSSTVRDVRRKEKRKKKGISC